jgi:integrase
MLMILARLGLRAPEAIAIQLDDIDWRAGTILIHGKGKRHDRMPVCTENPIRVYRMIESAKLAR